MGDRPKIMAKKKGQMGRGKGEEEGGKREGRKGEEEGGRVENKTILIIISTTGFRYTMLGMWETQCFS